MSELPLPSGRRADLVALDGDGEIWIVEIKSSIEDFRADQKWMDYRAHCDRLFFATTLEVPCEIFPKDTGLIVADAFGAQIVCEAPEHRLHAATRKSMMLRLRALRGAAAAGARRPAGAVRGGVLTEILFRCVEARFDLGRNNSRCRAARIHVASAREHRPATPDESSPRYFGWRVVVACFLMALACWGFGLYGHSVYLAELHAPARLAARR